MLKILCRIAIKIWVNHISSPIRRVELGSNNILLIEIDYENLDKILSSRILRLFNENLILLIFKRNPVSDSSHSLKLCKYFVTLSRKDLVFFRTEYKKIINFFNNYQNPFLILVPPKEPPAFKTRFNDGKVTFVMCQYSTAIKNIVGNKDINNLISLCFNITKYIMDNKIIDNLIIRQYDDLEISKDYPHSIDKRLIIPHKGNLNYLDSCLYFLLKGITDLADICVCFDEKITNLHKKLINKYSHYVTFYRLEPHNLGPYVSRQLLAESSKSSYLIFQDSDDIPTFDRLMEISKYMSLNPGVDWVGSQSIRLNEFTEAIDIIRYPIDVSKALAESDDYCLLLPTSTIKKKKFTEVGGFSTIRKMASDRQFLYLSHIKNLNMKNINKFLYLRRRRKHSLTMSLETGFGSDERDRLQDLWKRDFEKIKRRILLIDQSSLNQELRQDKIKLIEIN